MSSILPSDGYSNLRLAVCFDHAVTQVKMCQDALSSVFVVTLFFV